MTAPIRVLELRSVRGTGGGPDKTILWGAAHSDPAHVDVTVCYIRDARDRGPGFGARARELGIRYHEILEQHSFDRGIWPPLVDLVRTHRIDVVHAHDYKTDLLAYCLARRTAARPLATAHGWITNTARERFYCYWDRRVLARFPLVIAVSEPIRGAILACGADPRHVLRISNGIDPNAYRREAALRPGVRRALDIPADALVIGSVGRLEPEKRYDVLLHAVHCLSPSLRPFVVLVGEGRQRADLERLAARLGVGDRVRLTGYRADVREVQHAFDVYVQSSDSEGVANTLLEAMALQVPVVATNVGGTADVIVDGIDGLLVVPGDPVTIADAIRRTIDDAPAARARAASARRRVETELSFDHRQARLERVYEGLLQ